MNTNKSKTKMKEVLNQCFGDSCKNKGQMKIYFKSFFLACFWLPKRVYNGLEAFRRYFEGAKLSLEKDFH